MKEPQSPRLDYLDIDNTALALANYKRDIPGDLQQIAQGPDNLQTHYSFLSRKYYAIGLFSYALGYPLSETREAFSHAAKAYVKVFELRGTEPAFPAYSFTYDPSYPPGHPKSTVEFRPLHGEDEKDYSRTNSQRNYLAVCVALIAGEHSAADRLASMIWDPPEASYLGPNSFCTPNDQHLAYALRALFQEDHAAVAAELRKVRPRRRRDEHLAHEARMLRALSGADAESFLEGLASLLVWHERQARSKRNRREVEFFLSIPGLGLSALALRRGVCTIAQFPQDNVFLPIALIG